MTEYSVEITPQALEQLEQIKRYIAYHLQAPDTAEKWLIKMEKELRDLSFMPAKYSLTSLEPWRSQEIHCMTVGNHIVYYWIDQDNYIVWITAVVYGRKDQKRALEQMNFD